MNRNDKLIIFFLLIIVVGVGFSKYMPKEIKIKATTGLKIGSGDDITGLLLKQIIETNKKNGIEGIHEVRDEGEVFFDFTFKDC